jgi:hypothetical protein
MLTAAAASLTSVTWYPSRRRARNENILIRRIAETHFNRDAEQELGLTRRSDSRMLKFGIVATTDSSIPTVELARWAEDNSFESLFMGELVTRLSV